MMYFLFFFFQAEDGIRDGHVTGVQTCALPILGTAQYLPPEQAMGKAATGLGDIYALGVIGYEALVGNRPFTGKTQVDIAFAHVNQPVPPMPVHIDRRVRGIIMSMLAKDPEDRPRSAASLARIIEELLPYLDPPTTSSDGGARPPASRADESASGKSAGARERSEEHTSELQSRGQLVCRLLLEKKKIDTATTLSSTSNKSNGKACMQESNSAQSRL